MAHIITQVLISYQKDMKVRCLRKMVQLKFNARQKRIYLAGNVTRHILIPKELVKLQKGI